MKDADGNLISRAEIEAIVYYCGIALVVGGMAGLYIPVVMKKGIGVEAYSTYVFAVLAPMVADFLLGEPYWKKLTKVTKLRMGFAGAVVGISAIIALFGEHDRWGTPLGILAMLMVVPVWFFQAVFSERFRPEPVTPAEQKGSIGGDEIDPSKLGGKGLE